MYFETYKQQQEDTYQELEEQCLGEYEVRHLKSTLFSQASKGNEISSRNWEQGSN